MLWGRGVSDLEAGVGVCFLGLRAGLGAEKGVSILGLGADFGVGVGYYGNMNQFSSCCLDIFSGPSTFLAISLFVKFVIFAILYSTIGVISCTPFFLILISKSNDL